MRFSRIFLVLLGSLNLTACTIEHNINLTESKLIADWNGQKISGKQVVSIDLTQAAHAANLNFLGASCKFKADIRGALEENIKSSLDHIFSQATVLRLDTTRSPAPSHLNVQITRYEYTGACYSSATCNITVNIDAVIKGQIIDGRKVDQEVNIGKNDQEFAPLTHLCTLSKEMITKLSRTAVTEFGASLMRTISNVDKQ